MSNMESAESGPLAALDMYEQISDSEGDEEVSPSSLESLPKIRFSDTEAKSPQTQSSEEQINRKSPPRVRFKEDLEEKHTIPPENLSDSDESSDSPDTQESLQSRWGLRDHKTDPFPYDRTETFDSKYLSEYLQYHTDRARQLALIIDRATRRKKLEEIFPENDLKARLAKLETTQVAIEGFANSVTQYCYPPGPLLRLFLDVFVAVPVNTPAVRLAIFYVYNHLIQTFTNENIWKYSVSFQQAGLDTFCIPAIIHTNKIKCNNIIHICNCINIWRQRNIYSREVCDRLEHTSTNTPLIKNEPVVQHMFNVNDELGYLNVLYHVFKMPLVDAAFDKAAANCEVERLANWERERDRELMDAMVAANKEHEFNEAGRLSGQELIILHSACLDLGALIKENDHGFGILRREINKLNALLTRK